MSEASNTFNPDDPAFLANPYPVYARLHEQSPIFYHEGSGMWYFASHHDVDAILRDRRFGRSILHLLNREELDLPPENPAYEPFNKLGRHSMFDMEPPEHTRLRSLVHKAFTPRRIMALQSTIECIASALLDELIPQGEMDVLADFAAPLSVTVIATLLGIPDADRSKLRPWSNAIVKMYELDHTPEQATAAIQAAEEFADYLKSLARRRMTDPQDDLITALALIEEEGDRLSEDEMVSTCVLLLNAGHEATINVVGNGLRALFEHPDRLQTLKEDPSQAMFAIEELMRYDTPLQLFRRWVLQDMDYQGITLKQGMQVGLLFGAANNDPNVFDDPRTLNLSRSPNPHISFGGGVHFCLGAPLARMELRIAYQSLLGCCPNIQLSTTPQYHPTYVIRGLQSLDVIL
ncbi:MAG: cytochrome P450 [Anaerolineae bacterium]|nr:cytochrome P450 [Anaerolineae bacterium]